MWYYKDQEFTSSDIGDYIGFVYLITDRETGKKYVGKKNFLSTTRKPPLKGKKRKRVIVKESDWMSYHGSNEELKGMVAENTNPDRFHREILHLCKSKGEMSYLELVEQIQREVLLKPNEYFNSFVGGKIHRNHVKGLFHDQ